MQKTLDPDRRRDRRQPEAARAARRRIRWRYDPQFIANLEKIKLDPRPNTAKIFRVDYFRLPDADVDKLFNYYYDSIALYGEVERHIKKTKADAESLKAYAEKSASQTTKNYGVVFDNSGGKLIVANLVEIGDQVCKNGGKDCPRHRPDGLQGPLEHGRAVGRSQVDRQAGPRQRRSDEADAVHGRGDDRLAGPGPPGELQAARRQHPLPVEPDDDQPERADRGRPEGRRLGRTSGRSSKLPTAQHGGPRARLTTTRARHSAGPVFVLGLSLSSLPACPAPPRAARPAPRLPSTRPGPPRPVPYPARAPRAPAFAPPAPRAARGRARARLPCTRPPALPLRARVAPRVSPAPRVRLRAFSGAWAAINLETAAHAPEKAHARQAAPGRSEAGVPARNRDRLRQGAGGTRAGARARARAGTKKRAPGGAPSFRAAKRQRRV